jgi:hypothetical protein
VPDLLSCSQVSAAGREILNALELPTLAVRAVLALKRLLC